MIGHPLKKNEITDLAKLEVKGTEIKRAHKDKSLGLIVDEKLSWSDQFKLLKGKVAAGFIIHETAQKRLPPVTIMFCLLSASGKSYSIC